jgi:CrcB protein
MFNSYLGQILIVGAGGFVGAGARFALSGVVHRVISSGSFPWGTLVVNVVGCLAIGFLGGQMELRQLLGPSQRLFLMIGLLGGFTTFSTFAYETLSLAHSAEFARALANVLTQVFLCLAAARLGYLAAQQI